MDNNFHLNTDTPIEKIIFYNEGSFLSTGSNFEVIVPHGLPFTPLPYIQWSFTPDFSVPQEVTQGYGDLYTSEFPYVSRAYANNTSMIFNLYNFGSNATVYYRMYGLEPTTSGSPDVNATSGQSGLYDFTLNTDLSYLQIIDSNRIVVSTSQTIVHGLGYRPRVTSWEEVNDFSYGQVIIPVDNNVIYDAYGFVIASTRVGTNDISFTRSGTFHYRIYK